MNISFEEAKRLSIIKWESLINNTIPDFQLSKEDRDELKKHYDCGFCWRHNFQEISFSNIEDTCNNCEFGKVAGLCVDNGSLYDIHTNCNDESDEFYETAKKILKIIENLEEC